MHLTWLGHAAFRIVRDDGLHIITDPYTPELAGYAPFTEPADLVLMSSDNDRFHCRGDLIPGSPTIVNMLTVAAQGGEAAFLGVETRAIAAMEALDHTEHDPDQNALYRFTVDGVSIGHMGDIGNPLTDDQIAFLAGVDVLLALAGGFPTLPLDALKHAITQARPRLVIPMHFRTLRYRPRNTFWIERFLSDYPDDMIDFVCDTGLRIAPETLPASTRIAVLSHQH
jgi:L-ascorbate metabolism protein UlaG (beta-lactamase superfamily)